MALPLHQQVQAAFPAENWWTISISLSEDGRKVVGDINPLAAWGIRDGEVVGITASSCAVPVEGWYFDRDREEFVGGHVKYVKIDTASNVNVDELVDVMADEIREAIKPIQRFMDRKWEEIDDAN